MKPGTILTNYKIIKSEKDSNESTLSCNSSHLIGIKEKVQKEAKEIIDNAKKNAILEREEILNEANALLNETIELKKYIENNYQKNIESLCNLNITDFINAKNIEFSKNMKDINDKFDLIFENAKEDICDILLKSFNSLFGSLYDDPKYIKELLVKNFIGFEDSKNIELVLSENAFNKFTDDVKNELENELDIVFESIKADKKLSGVMLKTNLGSIEVSLEKQIELLEENIKNYIH